jgi:squalene synthase HpnC
MKRRESEAPTVSQLERSAHEAVRPSAAGTGTTGESGENFPVAARLLPPALRRDLRALYGVARTIDDLGDDAPGDRLAALDDFEADLRTIWAAGEPRSPALQRVVPTVRRHHLAIEPFLDLLTANRLDQAQATYPTWADLQRYCTYSANPVGRLVLAILDAVRDDRLALSDRVCTALQLLEHCQDVAEDRRRGRTYLPVADLVAHGVTDAELDAAVASPAVRAVVAYEVDRAAALLRSGRPLVRSLRGAGRVAVAGYVAGGMATVDALRRADHDVLAVFASPGRRETTQPRRRETAQPGRRETTHPRRRDTAAHALRLLAGRS